MLDDLPEEFKNEQPIEVSEDGLISTPTPILKSNPNTSDATKGSKDVSFKRDRHDLRLDL